MSRSCEITVYRYDKADIKGPEVFRVKAECVAGDEGIMAFWEDGHTIHQAYGDDGHFWWVGSFHRNWISTIVLAMIKLKD